MRLLFAVVAFAFAFPAHAQAESKVLSASGNFNKGSNWTPAGKPGLNDRLTVPVGKTAELGSTGKAGDLVVEGNLTGSGVLEENGSLTLASKVDWTGSLRNVGPDYLSSGGNRISSIQNPGLLRLTEDLYVGSMEWKGIVNLEGHDLRVDGLAYPLEESSSGYEGSRVTVGEWIVYPFELFEDKWTFQSSYTADFIVTGGLFKGAGWTYGSLTFEDPATTASGDSYEVEGTMTVDSAEVLFEPGQTVQAGALVFGPGEHVLRSSGVGATVECGCVVPPGVVLEGVTVR